MTREQHIECVMTWISWEKGIDIPMNCLLRNKAKETFHRDNVRDMQNVVFESMLFLLKEQLEAKQ